MDIDQLRKQYQDVESAARRLQRNLTEQIEHMLAAKGIPLGVPLETRIKDFQSIEEKSDRKTLDISNILYLDDLIGFRLILLFKSDLDVVCSLLRDNFDVLNEEDTGSRLKDSQFGYHSRHYVVKVPQKWLSLPTFADLDGFKCEIQVRTLAQHIWAAASHKLQYKREASVPLPLRRTIYRISALLETVDLEFDRILSERELYINENAICLDADQLLNVDVIERILLKVLPEKNRSGDEDYDDLINDLKKFDIETQAQLTELLSKNLSKVMKEERRYVRKVFNGEFEDIEESEIYQERANSGVFFSLVGLTREALRREFGSRVVTKTIS